MKTVAGQTVALTGAPDYCEISSRNNEFTDCFLAVHRSYVGGTLSAYLPHPELAFGQLS